MNISYFSNQFADRQGHGLSRYSRELFASMRAISDGVQITPVAAWSSMEATALQSLQEDTGLQLLPWGHRLTPAVWAFINAPKIEHWLPETDLVHAVALGYPVATRKSLVVTIHDLGPLTHPEYFNNTKPWIMRRSLKQTVEQADIIICVSQSTADELSGFVSENLGDRIRVVHEGVSDFFFNKSESPCLNKESDLPPKGMPFVLAAGKISPRKNIHGLLQAMDSLGNSIPHHLVLIGGDGWDMEQIHKQLDASAIRNRVHFPGYVSDEQLRALYAEASVYVHPSLYEGFGLTILEAMAVGCPVVTSDVYSLPEVAGDAAVLVDPMNISALADAIEAICLNQQLATDLVVKGKLRASEFQWKGCAEKTLDIYARVL
jgi:glycosyltransferase involved in cell wall biosynthesis